MRKSGSREKVRECGRKATECVCQSVQTTQRRTAEIGGNTRFFVVGLQACRMHLGEGMRYDMDDMLVVTVFTASALLVAWVVLAASSLLFAGKVF